MSTVYEIGGANSVDVPNTNKENAQCLVDQFDGAIKDLKLVFEKQVIMVSASFGITRLDQEENFEKILVAADKRLYEKKRSRKAVSHFEI